MMLFGYYNLVTKTFNKLTRISSTATLLRRRGLDIADDTFIWHYTIIDGSNGVKIGRGCQIGAWVGIFTHSSHLSIRIMGADYFITEESERLGWRTGSVEIGEYTFVAAKSIVLPGVRIGKGCIISAQSVVTKSVPDFSIVAGNPAKIVGDTRKLDQRYLNDPVAQLHYYAPEVITELRAGHGSDPSAADTVPD
jgi:acetyltransferase-like isoleucine patch superfamily enzyme